MSVRLGLFVVASCALLAGACGYRPLRSGLAGDPHVRVARPTSVVPGGADLALADEAAHGARGELAKFGALSTDDDATSLTLEVVRVIERSDGAGVTNGKALARGVEIEVVARGAVEANGNHWETVDLSATEEVATPGDSLAWDAARTAAARSAARKVGAEVARVVLGVP